jgi:alpha-muurolene/germacrene-A/gamma-muurolene synthase
MKNCKPGPAHRFKETLEQFFESVNLQAQDRDANQIPDLESFIDIRRDTSGCKSTFDLIEYAYDLDIPQEVLEHPVIEALKQGSNDLVAWSNVSFIPGASDRSMARAQPLFFRTSFPTTSSRPVATILIISSRFS